MRPGNSDGFTFVELIAVIAILGIVSITAMPSSSPQLHFQLQLAAKKIANAIRFAREQSINTKKPYGVLIDTAGSYGIGQEVFVYKMDTSSVPYTVGAVQRMPISKQLYQFDVSNAEPHTSVSISNTSKPFSYDSLTTSKDHLQFNTWGTPIFYDNSIAKYLTSQATITLRAAQITMSVKVDSVTGRVTIHE